MEHLEERVAPYDASLNYTTFPSPSYNPYRNESGTSMSTPYVTGLGALLLSYLNNPNLLNDPKNLAPEDVEEIIQRSAYNYNYYPVSGYDADFGWGRIDAGRAMDMVDKSKSQVLHLETYTDAPKTETLTEITGGTDIPLTIEETSYQVNAGDYLAEVWELSVVTPHTLPLRPNEEVVAFWARSSASGSFPLYETRSGINYLDPYEKDYIDAADENEATLRGYYYHLKDLQGNSIKWLPSDPHTVIGNSNNLEYTIYTRIPTITSIKPTPSQSDYLTAVLFPNPAADASTISVQTTTEEQLAINLYNNLGQLIEPIYNGKTKQIAVQVNTGKLENGIYLVKVESTIDNKLLKLVVQK